MILAVALIFNWNFFWVFLFYILESFIEGFFYINRILHAHKISDKARMLAGAYDYKFSNSDLATFYGVEYFGFPIAFFVTLLGMYEFHNTTFEYFAIPIGISIVIMLISKLIIFKFYSPKKYYMNKTKLHWPMSRTMLTLCMLLLVTLFIQDPGPVPLIIFYSFKTVSEIYTNSNNIKY